MFNKFFIGIDNGVTGSIGMIATSPSLARAVHYVKTPVLSMQDYTKKKKNITRINTPEMIKLLKTIDPEAEVHIMLERPLVNPKMFHATISAVRALEATQVIIEARGMPYEFIDSKEWQGVLLPKGCKGDDLKTASIDAANRLYPGKAIPGHKDADGLMIAHYCMLKYK